MHPFYTEKMSLGYEVKTIMLKSGKARYVGIHTSPALQMR